MDEISVKFTINYNRFKKKVYNYVLKMTGDVMLTEDITQTVFMKFYENLPVLKSENSFPVWIFKVARNEVFLHYRNKKSEPERFDYDETENFDARSDSFVDTEYEMKELASILKTELENLPYEQKEVFVMKEYGNLSYREIGELLQIEEKLVKSRLFKVRQKLINNISKLIS